ncbi:MAG: T9SS type A sorting domain-containing protein [Chitinophagales bacterium]|nr:T9SS type A sorting domain-containing protein [Chitinophagales bacterium]
MKSEKFTFTKHRSFGRFIKASILSAFMLFWYTGVHAQSGQCPLSCNDLVQVSMDDDCIVEITPAMILEGQGPSTCDYRVEVLGTNGLPLAPPPGHLGNVWITSANIGQTLTVRVWLGNNKCWGSIKIEDKLPPVITCFDEIIVGCYDPNYQPGVALPLPTATDNCGGNPVVTLLSDVTTDLECDPTFRAKRVLRYQAKDASGNLSAICERVIWFEKVVLADIRIPKNYDGLAGNRPPLECDGTWAWNSSKSNINVPFPTSNWDKNGNYYPDPEETGAPFVANPINISGYINGYVVAAPGSGSCVIGTLVYPGQQESYLANGCNLQQFRVDTFYNPIIGNNNICKINSTYTDTRIELCAKSFKVLREWKILDWCTGQFKFGNQVIAIMDTKAPVVTCPADLTSSLTEDGVLVAGIISADPYTCTGTWTVRPPVTIYDCNETTWTVKFKKADLITGGDPGPGVPFVSQEGVTKVTGTYPNFVIQGLPLGRTWVQYIVTDACGNVGECFTEIDVFDTTPPVAVCDEHTVVTLSNNGWAHVFAYTFDDGSHDNCSDVTFSVRRLTPGCNSNGSTNEALNPFTDFIQVCCEDVDREVMVELRVTDAFGNKNSCMVWVTTKDKVPPVITCPANITIDCGADTSAVVLGIPVYSETALSTPYYTDNCPNPKMSWRNSGSIDNCGQGVITRVFTVTDKGGLTASCTQTITVRNRTPYSGPAAWPKSPVEISGCLNADTNPDKTGKPTLGNGSCSQVAYTYEDQLFTFVDNVCYKILRKWTIIDWCKFAPNRDVNGGLYPSAPVEGVNTWTYTQVIKVTENEKPVITNNSKSDTDAFGENCDGYVDLKNSATDCTPAEQLKWTYSVDLNNDGVAPYITGTTNDASRVYPVGTHRITWTVEDHCGNLATTSYIFRVLDKKKPTPYCISQLTTVVMPSSGTIDIWARDFDKGSVDNCPTTGCGLKFTLNGFKPPVTNNEVLFNKDGIVVGNWPTTNAGLLAGYESGIYQRWLPSMCSSAKLYTCGNVGPNTENMSVWDAAGNTDFCTVTLNVQSNSGCTGSRIAGKVSTEANEMVSDVIVILENMDDHESRSRLTDAGGYFEFSSLKQGVPYQITPERNDDVINGVSTLDLVIIQRHILDHEKFNSPYKYLAADVNNDKRITASDISELRKIILGVFVEFPNNTSWRFLDKSVQITDPALIWNASEYMYINNFSGDMMNNNFIAIKTGDVNGSAVVNARGNTTESRSNQTLAMVAEDQHFETGDFVKVHFTADNFTNVAGAQWTLNFDASQMEFVKVESGSLNMDASNYNALQAAQGKVAFSWNDYEGKSVDKDHVLFTVEFRAITNNTIANTVKLSSDITKAEAYTQDLSKIDVALTFRNSTLANLFELGQNNPNPFTTSTVINFNLPEAAPATLTVYDMTGKVLKTISGQYVKGNNEIVLTANDFNAQGVMFYELESMGQKSTKKMIYLSK